MLKKRLIFTLLYSAGKFMLSRNFRLQAVGDLKWLQENYNFSQISYWIDELVVLDVTRENRNLDDFCNVLKALTYGNFVPITAGGGVTDVESAKKLLRSGADKISLNSGLFDGTDLTKQLAEEFGKQCVVGSVDVKKTLDGEYEIKTLNGSATLATPTIESFNQFTSDFIGEVYLNSIDRDGTGQGIDFETLGCLPATFDKPVILAGGVGNSEHLIAGLSDTRIDAIATANLFNFVGDGLKRARLELLSGGIDLPIWSAEDILEKSSNRIHK